MRIFNSQHECFIRYFYRNAKTDNGFTSHKIEMAEKDQTIMETRETIQVLALCAVNNCAGL